MGGGAGSCSYGSRVAKDSTTCQSSSLNPPLVLQPKDGNSHTPGSKVNTREDAVCGTWPDTSIFNSGLRTSQYCLVYSVYIG